jgi:hypothetical protein
LFVLVAVLPFCTLAYAEDEASSLERVEVTGSRISYRDLLETPAISITKQGDYVLQAITLVNDTRNKEARNQEIYATVEKLLSRSGNKYKVLQDDAFRTLLDRTNYKVELQEDSKRPDVSKLRLQIRMDIEGSPSQSEKLIRALRDFVKETPKIGRTEVDLDADTSLGMNKPERYRYELIEAISNDSQKIAAVLGTGCKVQLDGLNSRIEWMRVGATELLLYVPYSMAVTECSAGMKQ